MMNGYTAAAASLAKDWIYCGYRMTLSSNEKEKDALEAAGAKVVNDRLFAPHVVRDRELITGQNPASDQLVANALVEALEVQRYIP